MIERRHPQVRRDVNDLVRDESGKVSPSKIGGIVGQAIAVKYLLAHWEKVITSWDILTILLSVLVAPELFKKLLTMKYGGSAAAETTTTASAAITTVSTDVHSAPSANRPEKRARRVR